jgi:hypothetical protein
MKAGRVTCRAEMASNFFLEFYFLFPEIRNTEKKLEKQCRKFRIIFFQL